MADNIDIVIQDKIDSSIDTKLDSIADSAIRAENALDRLKNALALINSSPLNILQTAANSATNAINQNALANQKLATEQARTATASANAATAQQKTAIAVQRLGTEQERTATATAQAAAAQDRAALAALRLQQAQERATQANSRHGQSWVEMAKGMAAGMLVAHGIMLAVQGITGAISGGINAVDQYQQSGIQMAAILTSLAKDQSNIAATYQQSRQYAEGLNDTLQLVDANTSLNLANLQSITQEMAKQGVTLNTNNQSQVESFTRLANAVAVYSRNGKDERQVRQEVSALLRGEVKQGDELAKLLDRITGGHLREMLVKWKQNGTVIEEIGKRLAGFGPAAEEIKGTWSAATSSMKTSLDLIARAGFTKVVADLVDYIGIANQWLRENAQIIGSDIAVAWLTVRSVVGSLWDILKLIFSGLDMIVAGSLNQFLLMLTGANAQITSMWDVFKFIMRGLAFTASVLLPTLIEKIVDVVKIASGLIVVAVSFGEVMLVAIKGVAESLFSIGVGLWKGLTGDTDGMKEEFSKIFSGAVRDAFNDEVNVFKGTIAALGDDVKHLMSTKGLDSRLDAFFTSDAVGNKRKGGPQAPQLSPPIPTVDKNAEKRELALAKINSELDKELNNMYLLKDAREVANKLDQIEINFAAKKWKLSEDETETLRKKIQAVEDGKRTQKEFDSIYEKSVGPLRDYNSAQTAAKKLLDMGAISQADYARALLLAKNAYEDAAKPLVGINRELYQQTALLGYVGEAQLVAQQMQQYMNELRQKGIVLSAEENKQLVSKVANLISSKAINQELNRLYEEGTGKEIALQRQLLATNIAYKNGAMSTEAYNRSVVGIGLELDKLKLKMGDASLLNFTRAGLGRLVDGYEGALTSLSNSFGNFFQSLSDGFANSIGRAVVYADNLKEALGNIAREAVSGLISALVKLGIQYVVNAALGKSLAASSAAMSAATAASLATAWATPAALASLATEGSNAIAADAAIAQTVGFAQAMALTGYEQGGYTGNSARNAIAGVVHGQEFVVNASATARNRDLLEAMNRGDVVSNDGASSNRAGKAINVVIQNYGTSKEFDVQHVSPDEVRVIARDEAKRAVYDHAPKVVAGEIRNPNSQVSKSLERNTQTQRRR